MLNGFAVLVLSEDQNDSLVVDDEFKEIDPVICSGCRAKFRIFAELKNLDKSFPNLDLKDLRNRAESFIYRDCPNSAPEGHPRRPGHVSEFELLENGKFAF